MKCCLCKHGDPQPGFVTVTLARAEKAANDNTILQAIHFAA